MLATGLAVGSRYPDRTVSLVDSTVCVVAIPVSSVLVRRGIAGRPLLVPQGGAEKLPALGGGGLGGVSVAQGVEHDEVVDSAVIAHRGDRDPGGAQVGGVGLALVAQHVGLAVDDQRGRQA